ncbi:MAG TPA: hypothetical protein VF528_07015 [Pyrinomonadaceae bacterium]|jgi:hypothetical protein
METTPKWLLILQAIGNLAIVATFIVYWLQLRAMRGQLSAALKASRSQNLFTIIEYLQRPQFTEARRVLLSLKAKPYSTWTSEEKTTAERACSGYDAVAILINGNQEATEVVIKNWGYSIKECFAAATGLIADVRNYRGEQTWDDFQWLANIVSQEMREPQKALDAATATHKDTGAPGDIETAGETTAAAAIKGPTDTRPVGADTLANIRISDTPSPDRE